MVSMRGVVAGVVGLALASGLAAGQPAGLPQAVATVVDRVVSLGRVVGMGDELRPQRIDCAGEGNAAIQFCFLTYGTAAQTSVGLLNGQVQVIGSVVGRNAERSPGRKAFVAFLAAHGVDPQTWPQLVEAHAGCMAGAPGQTRRPARSLATQQTLTLTLEGTGGGCVSNLD